jgi:hypothetical protein
VPQYEGAEASETAEFMKILQGIWPERAADSWKLLQESLKAVTLA